MRTEVARLRTRGRVRRIAAAMIVVLGASGGAAFAQDGTGSVSEPADGATGGLSSSPGGLPGDPAVPATGFSAVLKAKRVLLGGPRPQTLTLTTADAHPSATVSLTGEDGIVQSWDLGPLAAGESRDVVWTGNEPEGRGVADGRYRFAIAVDGGAPAPIGEAFTFLRAYFPVRGAYTFGDGLGAGRGHQGQDVLAACGTPLLAARGGTVQFAGFHARAGNYVVIDVVGSPSDMVYMHLREPSPLKTGDAVSTGQRIGDVGQTGRASACHLHFELWSGPGWYQGGRPLDAGVALRRWERQSGAGRDR